MRIATGQARPNGPRRAGPPFNSKRHDRKSMPAEDQWSEISRQENRPPIRELLITDLWPPTPGKGADFAAQ
jgi:hypothetical protein